MNTKSNIDKRKAEIKELAAKIDEAEKNNLLKQVLSAAEQVISYTDYVLEHNYHLTREDFSKSEVQAEPCAGDVFISTLDAAEKQAAAENGHRPPHTPHEQER